MVKITGSTVVLTCCKGDGQSMEDPIFGPSQLGNPLTDFDKIENRWLRRRRDPLCQIWLLYV